MIFVVLSLYAGKPQKLNIGVNIFADFDSVIALVQIQLSLPEKSTRKRAFFNEINPYGICEMHFVREICFACEMRGGA